jgi:HTH-type transcriptional regulator/antitoxin HigA
MPLDLPLKPIRTAEEHRAAMRLIEKMWDAQPGTPSADALEALAILVEDFERRQFPTEASMDPIAFLRGFMDMNGYRSADLGAVIGSRSRASELLARKRRLSLEQVRKIAYAWHISADLLIGAADDVAEARSEKDG